jgi:hypothetical protein
MWREGGGGLGGLSDEYTVKKDSGVPVPSRGMIKLFPARESLVKDIPAGDRKTANLFLKCRYQNMHSLC